MDAHGLDCRERKRFAGFQVEYGPVERALDDAALDIEIPFAQGRFRMAAGVVERVEGPAGVEDRDRCLVDLDTRSAAGWDVARAGHVDPALAHSVSAAT